MLPADERTRKLTPLEVLKLDMLNWIGLHQLGLDEGEEPNLIQKVEIKVLEDVIHRIDFYMSQEKELNHEN